MSSTRTIFEITESINRPFLDALESHRIGNILDNFEPLAVPAQTVLVQQNRPGRRPPRSASS